MGFKEINLEIHRIIFLLLILLLLISSRYKDYFKNYKLLLNLFLVFIISAY